MLKRSISILLAAAISCGITAASFGRTYGWNTDDETDQLNDYHMQNLDPDMVRNPDGTAVDNWSRGDGYWRDNHWHRHDDNNRHRDNDDSYNQDRNIRRKFERWFKNDMYIVNIGEPGDYGELILNLDIADLGMDNPILYTYDTDTHRYHMVNNTKYYTTDNGELHLKLDGGDYLIISDGPLTKY